MRSPGTGAHVIHLGLGAFHRAHQAWYTHHADRITGEQSGIWAFTGRRPDAARVLADQGFRYTLIERGAAGDELSDIASITAASAGLDLDAWRAAWRQSELQVVTLTVTEASYRRFDDDLGSLQAGTPATALARIVTGLDERRRAGLGPVAVVSCDNLSANGRVLADAVTRLAADFDSGLAAWIDEQISFPQTMVDRITPGAEEADCVQATDWRKQHGDPVADRMPVVCEPFSEWVIAGAFPAGRPAWEQAGAQFVDDSEPYERRKLWLLNAGHTLLAYVGMLRGWRTIDQTMGDAYCTDLLEDLWTAAAAVLPFDDDTLERARDDLRIRFSNPRIAHQLAKIATDGTQKMSQRAGAIHRARREHGLAVTPGIAASFAGWLLRLRREPEQDQGSGNLRERLADTSSQQDQIMIMLEHCAPALADEELVAGIAEQIGQLDDAARG